MGLRGQDGGASIAAYGDWYQPEILGRTFRVVWMKEVVIAECCVVDDQFVEYAAVHVDALEVFEILTPHDLLRFSQASQNEQELQVAIQLYQS